MSATAEFAKWATSFSGCDGGDIGTPADRSIWFCGIEWGGQESSERLAEEILRDESQPRTGYSDATRNEAYIFNRQALKILSAIDGTNVSNYREFCSRAKPFTQGSSGYFKLNLYPVSFKDTSPSRWHEQYAAITGFSSKQEYIDWCRIHRFGQIRKWAFTARPKLILCLGKQYRADYKLAFHEGSATFNHESIDSRDLWWSVNSDGTLVVIIPFMVNRHGLTRNDVIQKFGDRIARLMEMHGCR
ncbi:hypothetical protein [Vandammella animalimorsus]|uniref:hypothetical protein n=1 Tax=Vandammella animalimorsus TaxID=2029117 RepID=UPI001180F230|nr:hypothetical protein [Vandammella animalimorsus]